MSLLLLFSAVCILRCQSVPMHDDDGPFALSDVSSSISVNVFDFGAHGNGVDDDTAAFEKAIQAAQTKGVGYVVAPVAQYLFKGQLVLPDGISLVGTYLTVPSHSFPVSGQLNGSVLMPTFGRGSTDLGDSFITMRQDCSLKGFSIYYPEQPCQSQIPAEYPPTIHMTAANAAVQDIELLNSYIGIWAAGSHRHYIARVQGQPIMVGLYIDETYDIGRIEDVHFNPWFCKDTTYMYTQTMFGRSFVFGRSDWEYVLNTFSFGYAIGYHFIETETGSMNGNFLGLGADYACNHSVKVDAAQPAGLLFTNGEFTAFHNSQFAPNNTFNSTQIMVSGSNTGPVVFEATSFWGPATNIATLEGDSTTTFSSCVFVEWEGGSAIDVDGGNLILTGNTFSHKGPHVSCSSNAQKVIITNNICKGGCEMHVQLAQQVVLNNNL